MKRDYFSGILETAKNRVAGSVYHKKCKYNLKTPYLQPGNVSMAVRKNMECASEQ